MLSSNQVWAMAVSGRPIFKNIDTEFTIEYGCKIQRHVETGELTFFNCRLGGDFYQKILDTEAFYVDGFNIAALEIGIKTMQLQVERLKQKYDKKNDNRYKNEIENVEERIATYVATRDSLRNQGKHARG